MNTNWNDQDYEAVAQFLDGQPGALTDAQRALAEQVRADARALRALDVPLPRGVLQRVHARLRGGLPRLPRGTVARRESLPAAYSWRPRKIAILTGAAAAAILVLALVLHQPPTENPTHNLGAPPQARMEKYPNTSADIPDVNALAADVDSALARLEQELAAVPVDDNSWPTE